MSECKAHEDNNKTIRADPFVLSSKALISATVFKSFSSCQFVSSESLGLQGVSRGTFSGFEHRRMDSFKAPVDWIRTNNEDSYYDMSTISASKRDSVLLRKYRLECSYMSLSLPGLVSSCGLGIHRPVEESAWCWLCSWPWLVAS